MEGLLKLSKEARSALIFKKLIDPKESDPEFRYLAGLSQELQEVAYILRGLEKVGDSRQYRLEAELAARDKRDLIQSIHEADATVDLDLVENGDKWKFLNLGDAYQTLPPLVWTVKGILSRPSLNIFFGAVKSMKSLVIQDMAICVASGHRWLVDPHGMGGFEVSQTNVAWLDYENGLRRTQERLAALGRARKLPADININYVSMPTPWLDASKAEDMGRLMDRLDKMKTGMLIIDHFTQITGQIDENTSGISTVMGHLRGMVEYLNLTLVIIHHQIKGVKRFDISPSESLRGHGSIPASADLTCVIEKSITQKGAINLKPADVRGAPIANFGAIFSYEPKTDGSLELETARFWGVSAENVKAKIETIVLDCVEETPGINQTTLRATIADLILEVGDQTIRGVIAKLEKSGKLEVRSGKQGAKHYYVPMVEKDD